MQFLTEYNKKDDFKKSIKAHDRKLIFLTHTNACLLYTLYLKRSQFQTADFLCIKKGNFYLMLVIDVIIQLSKKNCVFVQVTTTSKK